MNDLPAYCRMAEGETITIAGVHERIPNANRRWWQFWRPRLIDGPNLQVFRVTSQGTAR